MGKQWSDSQCRMWSPVCVCAAMCLVACVEGATNNRQSQNHHNNHSHQNNAVNQQHSAHHQNTPSSHLHNEHLAHQEEKQQSSNNRVLDANQHHGALYDSRHSGNVQQSQHHRNQQRFGYQSGIHEHQVHGHHNHDPSQHRHHGHQTEDGRHQLNNQPPSQYTTERPVDSSTSQHHLKLNIINDIIITAPTRDCSEGERRDFSGRCRRVF